MTTIGLCTHFSQTDEWAFDYALKLAKHNNWHMIICHWLQSPYSLRRDMVNDDLFKPQHTVPVDEKLLTKLEYQLREYYDQKLGEFTDVAFKLCEGNYQVELTRCFRQNLLDLVVMGYQPHQASQEHSEKPQELFALEFDFPLIIVGAEGEQHYLINQKASQWMEALCLDNVSWKLIQPQPVVD
jgi:hypothetical protein